MTCLFQMQQIQLLCYSIIQFNILKYLTQYKFVLPKKQRWHEGQQQVQEFDNIQKYNIYIKKLREMSRNWCFICQKEFELSNLQLKECPTCKQQVYQQITAETHPEQYQIPAVQPVSQPAVQPHPQQPNSTNPAQQPMNLHTGILQPLMGLSNIFTNVYNQGHPPLNNMNQGNVVGSNSQNPQPQTFQLVISNIGSQLPQILSFSSQIANFFMQNLINSGQSYRRATEAEINALEKIEKAHQCAICQSQNQAAGYKLRCGHQFHEDCIKPWFQRANTCPTCRDTL